MQAMFLLKIFLSSMKKVNILYAIKNSKLPVKINMKM
jgi:hypothetical protein